MAWDERQRAMLLEIGVPVWQPATGIAADPAAAPRPRPAAATAQPAPSVAERSVRPPAPPADVPPPPRDTARLAALGWEALRAEVESCQACSLCRSRSQTVFGVGHVGAHWMVVGEAPGEQEDRRGEPFVGAAGQLLDRMLQALGLTRADAAPAGAPALRPEQQVYIANTLKCRPPHNRNPQPDELAQCEPFLIRQIELLRPKLILAMGRFAVQALLRKPDPIGALRGRVHVYHGVPLVVTYHPAYLLRNPADKARAWDDLCLAAATMESLAARG